MLKKVLIGLALAVVLFLALVALQPADFRVSRSTSVSAPPAAAFDQVNDFRRWVAWSPWAKRDPQMKTTYSGAESGVGSVYEWAGNDEVGEGRMTILESKPGELISIKLEFLKPFEATNTAEFTFKAEGDGALVTWSMFGKNGFMGKAIHLFMDMDKMVGGDFEKGLVQLKMAAEASAQAGSK
ncbi:MAG: SRPBCC family protein [Planctomycetes bacterium]|nr:SRPBCC family protein [Planctomycetota bacterium]